MWTCGDQRWSKPADMIDGQFVGNLEVDCSFEKKDFTGFNNLFDFVRDHLAQTRQIHEQSERLLPGGKRQRTLDTTVTLAEDDNKIEIREIVTLTTDGKSLFLFETRSTSVSATGMAGFLKEVTFSTRMEKSKNSEQINLFVTNSVKVKRPWYALSPLFFMISKGVAKDKFEAARSRLMPQLIENL